MRCLIFSHVQSFQASNQSTLTPAAKIQVIIPSADTWENLKRSRSAGTVRIRTRLHIVPANTHPIALFGVRIVEIIVSDQDRFVRIRSRFASTMVIKVIVRTSVSPSPLIRE